MVSKKYKLFFAFLVLIIMLWIYTAQKGNNERLYPDNNYETTFEEFDTNTKEDSQKKIDQEDNQEQDTSEENVQESSEKDSVEDGDNKALPRTELILGVPFASQAPFGDWADPRQQHGCEEASLLMAHYWILGKPLPTQTALEEIFAMSEFEDKNYGGAYDLSIADTLKFWREYFGYKKSFVKYNISMEDIKKEIAKGNPTITPMDGTKLNNPHYTAPGPERHELVVIGYDDNKQEFITHDPGTRYGENYHYNYDIFMNAIRDYKTGFDEPVDIIMKAMLVIEKE